MDKQFTSLTDTHQITYLQKSVVGKAKEKIQAYSCDPIYYAIASKELMDHFDPSIVVNAFIKQLEAWRPNTDYNTQIFVSFASLLKRLVQAFEYLGFKADLQSSTLMKKAKEKIPQNILIKWTEYKITSIGNQPTVMIFRSGLKYRPKYTTKSTEKMLISRLIIGTPLFKTIITLAELTTTMIIGTAML